MAKKSENVFAVIGLGTFGRRVCEVLSARGASVIAVDSDPVRIDGVKDIVTQAVVMDATDEEGYPKLALEDVGVAVVAIGDNIEGSILATALLKQNGVRYIIARALTNIHRQVLIQVGADDILNLEEDEGERLAVRLIAPQILDRTPLSKDISIAEVYCPDEFFGKTLAELSLRQKLGLTVVAIKRNKLDVDEEGNSLHREDLVFPQGDEPLNEDDILIVVGYNDDIEQLKSV
jgi:trk system potassium uptake protein TrkA